MILLDTNVLSALMLAEPDPTIVRWLDRMEPSSIWTTVITVFEIRYGLEKRGPGRRTRALEEAFAALIREDLDGRVAPVDGRAAEAAAMLATKRAAAGRAVDFRDTLIAGIALSQRAKIATRNIRHFADLEARVVDPWAGSAKQPAQREPNHDGDFRPS